MKPSYNSMIKTPLDTDIIKSSAFSTEGLKVI